MKKLVSEKDCDVIRVALGVAIEKESHALAGLVREPPSHETAEAVRERQRLMHKYESLRTALLPPSKG
jgi:hypothetical protein